MIATKNCCESILRGVSPRVTEIMASCQIRRYMYIQNTKPNSKSYHISREKSGSRES